MKLQPESTLGAEFGSAGFATRVASDSLQLRERADIGCLLLTAAVDVTDVMDSASAAVGVQLPVTAGMTNSPCERLALWLSPRSWLVQCDLEDEAELASRVNAAFPDRRLNAALFTDYLCWLELSGEGSENLLQEGSFLCLERNGLAVGHAKRTLVAGIAAVIIRQAERTWLIGVERSRARYFTDWLNAARTTICASGG